MSDETIKQIEKNLTWLNERSKSVNILAITRVVNNLLVHAKTLSDDVSEAYALMNVYEDEYKISVAKYVSGSSISTAKAEREAEVEYADLKRNWTDAKNTYKRLDNFLDRIDKIADAQRQKISVIKQTDMKNL
jgi:hypothetical protein